MCTCAQVWWVPCRQGEPSGKEAEQAPCAALIREVVFHHFACSVEKCNCISVKALLLKGRDGKEEREKEEGKKKGRNEREERGKMETREPILKEKREEFVCHFLFSPSEFGTSSVPSGWQRDVKFSPQNPWVFIPTLLSDSHLQFVATCTELGPFQGKSWAFSGGWSRSWAVGCRQPIPHPPWLLPVCWV